MEAVSPKNLEKPNRRFRELVLILLLAYLPYFNKLKRLVNPKY